MAGAFPKGMAYWPGVKQVVSAQYTLSHGISPSVATIRCAEQESLPKEFGTLILECGPGRVQFPDCKLAEMTGEVTTSGRTWTLTIYDRRWKWEFGRISGAWNTRLANGEVDPDREMSPQNLTKLCLEAMQESRVDVGQLPNTARPEVNWDNDVPAKALADLVEQLGCRVVLRTDNRVQICRVGVGAELPGGQFTDLSDGINPPERPEKLIFVGGPNRYQFDLGLEAVGQDTDGTIKLIADLSYKPANGWGKVDLPNMRQVAEASRRLALETVYRWYRIYYDADFKEPPAILGYGKILNGWQIVPIEEEQVVTWEDLGLKKIGKKEERNSQNLPALISGIFSTKSQGIKNSAANAEYRFRFRLLRDLGIVEFDDQVYAWTDGAEDAIPVADFQDKGNSRKTGARLKLTASCSIRDPVTWTWLRYQQERKIGTVGTPPRVLKHEEVVMRFVAGKPQNKEDCDKEATYYLDAAEAEYRINKCADRSWPGVVAVSPDGKIQQVSWTVGPPAITKASLNREFHALVPSFEERRRLEKVNRQLVDEMRAQQQKGRAQKQNRNPFAPAN